VSNPFAPTPIGKDWTPPQPPAPPVEENSGLGDLFDDAEPRSGSGPDLEEQVAPAALGDLFEEAGTPPETMTGGLGGLFGQTSGDAPSETLTTEDTPKERTPAGGANEQVASGSVIKPRVRRRGLVGTVSDPIAQPTKSTPDVAMAPSPSQGGARDATKDPAATEPPADSGAQEQHTPARWSDAPKPGANTATGTQQESGRRPARRNLQESERIWVLVDQTLALIGTDSALQRLAQAIELTQDLELYGRQRSELESALRPRMASSGVAIGGPADIEKIIARVHDELSGISVLGELWRDPTVDEILVDRWDIVNVERNGRLEQTDISFRSPQHAEGTARSLALKISDRAVSRSIPLVTAELPGARVTFAFGAVVKGGLSVTIRKFKKLLGLNDLLRFGSLNEEMVEFLRDAVHARGSVLVSGGTGTGKTTIINLLSTFIPDNERVITIEDAFELKLANTHVVSLQTKEASSSDDTVSVTLANLLRNTLRMRPDRIIVGEIREGEGAMVMLAAANTGHDGTITTIHANGVDAALNERLPDLVRQARSNRDDLAIQRSIAGAFDLAIQITRGRSGRRFISEIALITGVDKTTAEITTESVFVGEETETGVRFERFPVRSETEFTRRMRERGGDRWAR
jgi:pilus assembly protein CpaF